MGGKTARPFGRVRSAHLGVQAFRRQYQGFNHPRRSGLVPRRSGTDDRLNKKGSFAIGLVLANAGFLFSIWILANATHRPFNQYYMLTRVRICNESEARLMVQDGSFLDYLRHWDEQFPQTGGMEWLTRFGYSLFNLEGSGLDGKDYLALHKVRHIDNTVLFEIGENIILKKERNCWSLFHNVDNIWVQDRYFKGLDDFQPFSALSYLFKDFQVKILVSEREIKRTQNLRKLAKQVMRHFEEFSCYYKFGNHELWETDNESGNIQVYGEGFHNYSMRKDLKDIESHIRQYGKTIQVPH